VRDEDQERQFNEAVGSRVRVLRQEQKLKQPDLADRIGISKSQLQRYERGQSPISPRRLSDMCSVLGTTSDHLLGRDRGATPQAIRMARLFDQLEPHLQKSYEDYFVWLAGEHRRRVG
jgi:transcriptional regulator with XRE-family HTH domain